MRGLHIITRAGAAAAALLIAALANAAPAPQAGGIAPDMTLDAARTATPAIAWQDEKSQLTGRPIAIWADAAFVLEEQPYRVALRPFSHGAARLSLTSESQVENGKACRKRVVALAVHFDAYFDKIEPSWSFFDMPRQAAPTITYNRLPGGAGYVSATPNFIDDGRDHDTLNAGRNARVGEIEFTESDAMEWDAGQRATKDYPYALDLTGAYHDGYNDVPPSCRIEATVSLVPPGRPVMDTLDPANQKLITKPSAATMHYSLDGIDLPPEGLSLAYRCVVERPTGKLRSCNPDGRQGANAPTERAALWRLAEMKLDPAHLDPDSDLMLQTFITIKLSPSDRLKNPPPPLLAKTDALIDARPRDVPVWTQRPSPETISRHYPPEALRQELRARVVATCRIVEDLSLACTKFEIDPPDLTMFEAAAKDIIALYRAGPKLQNGEDAVGKELRIPLRFELE